MLFLKKHINKKQKQQQQNTKHQKTCKTYLQKIICNDFLLFSYTVVTVHLPESSFKNQNLQILLLHWPSRL